MHRLLLLLAAMGAVACCLTGCAGVAGAIAGNLIDDLIDGGGDDDPAVPTALQGTWRQIAGTAGGAPVIVSGVNTIAFYADETYRREWSAGAVTWEQGTLHVSGATVVCRVTGSGDIARINQVTTLTYQIVGSTLVLTFTEGGVVYSESFIRS